MKIGILCYPTYGGSGVVATELGQALAKEGHQVHFINYSQPVRLEFFANNIFFHEVRIMKYPLFEYPPYELALISTITDVVAHENLDILHVHYAIPHAFAAYSAKLMLKEKGFNIPVITTLHGTDITLVGKDASFQTAVEISINHSDSVTAVSRFLKDETYQLFNIKQDIEVIPNFVDKSRFYKKNNEFFKHAIAPEGERIICHTSNFRKVKRVEDVIHIFSGIRKNMDAKLLLVGDGPDRNKVEHKCRESNYCGDIRFLGKVDSVEDVLSVSDLFLLPSETESFGLAALEALACEVPVVSSNAGGLKELIEEGFNGYTRPIGDIEGMTEASLEILSEENLEAFKKRALESTIKFEIGAILPMYEKLYDSVIEKDIESTV